MNHKELLNRKETIIFNSLRNNSRRKLQDISKDTKIPVSTAYDILNKLKEKTIEKFTIIPRFESLGYKTRAIIIIRPDKEKKESLKKSLSVINHINSLFLIDGSAFLLEIILRDNSELNAFLSRMENSLNVKNYDIHLVFEDIKRENFNID